MALGIRGSNPIWTEFDLQGKIFDDTFYLFVLENTIPYIPAIVYRDPNLNIASTNPIRFLGNGTLPIDIYFESNKVYRLEFRQGPTQADPLIYEVNNYIAGSGGSTPPDTVALTSSNQVTNPQFALMNLQNPVTITGTDPAPIHIAPGWYLELAGTGSVTITQVPLNDANINPSNAPYALRLTLNGWTNDSVFLRQRFEQNGMLWSNKFVSSTLTARLDGSPQSVNAILIDSNNDLLGTVLPSTVINESWNEFTGYDELPITINPNTPPAAYIDYKLSIPSNIDIYLTSIQLVVQDLPVQPRFEQDSINRQIDHTYNTAYPIIPIGTVIDFGGFGIPEHYYFCDGSAKSRVRDYLLFQSVTNIESVTLTSGVNTFTVVSSLDYYIGMSIEGNGVAASTTITNIVGNTITMSNNATDTGLFPVRFFAYGAGDGSTTFNVPDLRNYVIAGVGGNLFGTTNNGVGKQAGTETHTMIAAELPPHTHDIIASSTTGLTSIPTLALHSLPTPQQTGPGPGTSTPFSIVQPTTLMKKCIRFE